MKDLLEKISSYNIFNYLLPGIIFSVIISATTEFNFIQDDILIGLFFYYFIGLVVSRFGSLVLEPFLKWIGFINFASYSDYINASKEDSTIELLSEINNMYRTLLSLIVLFIFVNLYLFISEKNNWSDTIHWTLIILALMIVFLFSYKKQTSFVKKRIQHQKNNKE